MLVFRLSSNVVILSTELIGDERYCALYIAKAREWNRSVKHQDNILCGVQGCSRHLRTKLPWLNFSLQHKLLPPSCFHPTHATDRNHATCTLSDCPDQCLKHQHLCAHKKPHTPHHSPPPSLSFICIVASLWASPTRSKRMSTSSRWAGNSSMRTFIRCSIFWNCSTSYLYWAGPAHVSVSWYVCNFRIRAQECLWLMTTKGVYACMFRIGAQKCLPHHMKIAMCMHANS
jgi:hypothetical protein